MKKAFVIYANVFKDTACWNKNQNQKNHSAEELCFQKRIMASFFIGIMKKWWVS